MAGNTSSNRDNAATGSDLIRLAYPLPEPYLLVSASGAILAANPAAVRAFGIAHSPDGLALERLLTDPPERIDAFLRAASRSTSLIPGAFTIPDEAGEERRFWCSGCLVRPLSEDEPPIILIRFRPHEDTVPGFLMLNERIRDLSAALHERRRMQQALEIRSQKLVALTEDLEREKEVAEEASRSKSRFLAAMSHELRTPLNGILGYVDLLNLGLEGSLTEGQTKQVARIRRGATHLAGVIDQILTFARLEGEEGHMHLATVDLVDVATEATEMSEPAYVEAHLQLVRDFPTASVVVRTDPVKVRQILLNLLSNAVRFTRHGGVEVSVRNEDGWARVDVRDSGIGIDPAHIELVFEPYWQLERDKGGTGLGLSVTREFARRLGGEVTVESVPGSGATFTLCLPGQPAPKHILLVDDDPNAQEIYRTVLMHGGFDVTITDNGGDAVRLAGEELPDLILLDIDLPVLDGWEVAKRLSEDPRTRGLKVMGVSAGATAETFQMAESLGFEAFYSKPFPPAELLAAVQRHTGMEEGVGSALGGGGG